MEFGSDFGAAAAVTCPLQDLTFAFGERVGLGVPGFGGQCGINDTKTAMDAADSIGKFGCGTIFKEIAACASVECAAKIAGAGKSSEDNCSGIGVVCAETSGELEPGHLRHFDIGDKGV